MQHLHTMKTAGFFEGSLTVPTSDGSGEDSLVSVTHINLCIPGRIMVVALSSSQILIFNWNNTNVRDITALASDLGCAIELLFL